MILYESSIKNFAFLPFDDFVFVMSLVESSSRYPEDKLPASSSSFSQSTSVERGTRLNSSASITLVDSSGREFHTRFRTSDLTSLLKNIILANAKAQLEEQKSAKEYANRARNGRPQELPSAFAGFAPSSSWLYPANSSRSNLEAHETSQPRSEESSSSSSGSTYNLAAKLRLFERKHDLSASISPRRSHFFSETAVPEGQASTPKTGADMPKISNVSNERSRKITKKPKRSAAPVPKSHTDAGSIKLTCDEVFDAQEEGSLQLPSHADLYAPLNVILPLVADAGGRENSGDVAGTGNGSYQSVAPMKTSKKRIMNRQVLTGMREAEFSMPPKLRVKKSRGRGNRCRKVYGIMRRDLWCKFCQWKKKCARFDDDGNITEGESHPPGYVPLDDDSFDVDMEDDEEGSE